MKNKWVIVCGVIRDPGEAQAKLRLLGEWKRSGEIDDVVVSTWFGELEKYPDIAIVISENDFFFVESPQPAVKMSGHAFHQSKSIHLALRHVPDGALVFRLRPDAPALSPGLLDVLHNCETTLAKCSEGSPLGRKVGVATCLFTSPFYINDMILLGEKADLLKIFHFDYFSELDFANFATEQYFFSHPFLAQFPIFRTYLRVSPPGAFNNPALAGATLRAQLDSEFYLLTLATHLLVLRDYFAFPFWPSQQPDDPQRKTIAERTFVDLLLAGFPDIGLFVNEHLNVPYIRAPGVIEIFTEGLFRRDNLGDRFITALDRVKQRQFHRDWVDDFSANSPMVKDFVAAVKEAHPYTTRTGNAVAAKHFTYPKVADRVGLITDDDVYKKMEAEINALRRTIDDLMIRKA
jgi:hypothetical protein